MSRLPVLVQFCLACALALAVGVALAYVRPLIEALAGVTP